jgi:hypothetical protein
MTANSIKERLESIVVTQLFWNTLENLGIVDLNYFDFIFDRFDKKI